MGYFSTAANSITQLIPLSGQAGTAAQPTSPATIQFNSNVVDAVSAYQKDAVKAEFDVSSSQSEDARLAAVIHTLPITSRPKDESPPDVDRPDGLRGLLLKIAGRNSDEGWSIRKKVAEDMHEFYFYMK
jgi:hypothetical protein